MSLKIILENSIEPMVYFPTATRKLEIPQAESGFVLARETGFD